MGLFERLKRAAPGEWQAYTTHPFTDAMADGSLTKIDERQRRRLITGRRCRGQTAHTSTYDRRRRARSGHCVDDGFDGRLAPLACDALRRSDGERQGRPR